MMVLITKEIKRATATHLDAEGLASLVNTMMICQQMPQDAKMSVELRNFDTQFITFTWREEI